MVVIYLVLALDYSLTRINFMIDRIRTILYYMICYVWALLMPVHNIIYAVLILLAMNFIFGLTADIVEMKHRPHKPHEVAWDNKKAIWAFIFLCIIIFVVCGFYIIGAFLNKPEEALTGISWFIIAAVWFFGRNINRNILKIIPPETAMYQFFNFTYYVLSLQMVEKIPYLGDFLKAHPESSTEEEEK